ncbi:DNA alkylation repair protein [Intrasporangium oryzae NRRL B-24470]|uniref:DNA alkylation repair protein n=1 Tax=Intrasporangium oryzae NRRL B-24470 TaxID=1386089 RepID=W9G7R1_9MICO|nr:DNA alkylation repair protein [Intrasporangium oryzae]EWT02045.1 DNA alkylation repair protein [Intrasporangium oryzae NRRL B-24470]
MSADALSDPEARLDLAAAITAALEQAADPERAAGQQRYMKSAMPYFGLTSPAFRAVVGPILRDPAYRLRSRDAWLATIEAIWRGATHREQWYAALALARHRPYRAWVDSDAMPLWERLIREGAWWDVVDDIATHLVRDTVLAAPAVEAPRMREWARSDSLWVRRAAILCQVGTRERLDQELLTDVIEPTIGDPDFFARKAIGWALRDHARSDPEWVRRFVAGHPDLSGLSRREALKHLGPLP